MVGVVPGGGGDGGVRFGWVRGLRGPGGVGGVEVAVKCEGVVGVALQGATLWWWMPARVSVMAWVSSGWGLISMKVWWSAPAVAMAWLNRTGLRRLAAQ